MSALARTVIDTIDLSNYHVEIYTWYGQVGKRFTWRCTCQNAAPVQEYRAPIRAKVDAYAHAGEHLTEED